MSNSLLVWSENDICGEKIKFLLTHIRRPVKFDLSENGDIILLKNKLNYFISPKKTLFDGVCVGYIKNRSEKNSKIKNLYLHRRRCRFRRYTYNFCIVDFFHSCFFIYPWQTPSTTSFFGDIIFLILIFFTSIFLYIHHRRRLFRRYAKKNFNKIN